MLGKVKLKVKKGDNVTVIAGDDKGKKGRVLEVFIDKGRVIVEGVNLASKHTKPNAKHPQGGIIKQEAAINISNLMVNDENGRPTRVGRRMGENGKLVRYAKTTGEEIK
ncbi:MAG: 50S ribosomal protein L24 [Prevotellaceae bacterium]|jgi:large subunit ribosomal protein L24|nr:50S ribosomal protein L24 [Prevotellaceae bacterium]